jgi:hypothetical protein
MHTVASPRTGQFHAANHLHTDSLSFGNGGIQAVEGVMISQRYHVEAGGCSLADELLRTVCAV